MMLFIPNSKARKARIVITFGESSDLEEDKGKGDSKVLLFPDLGVGYMSVLNLQWFIEQFT